MFNTPFELSLHVIMLLDLANNKLTVDRITAYDFITVYSSAFGITGKSLNGENEFAFSELSARRNRIKDAIKELVLDGLVTVEDEKNGILFSVSEAGRLFSQNLQSEYAVIYRNNLFQVIAQFGLYDDIRLLNEINKQSTLCLRR